MCSDAHELGSDEAGVCIFNLKENETNYEMNLSIDKNKFAYLIKGYYSNDKKRFEQEFGEIFFNQLDMHSYFGEKYDKLIVNSLNRKA